VLPLIRPSATFSRQKGREKENTCAFSRFYQREKVAEGRMRGRAFRTSLRRKPAINQQILPRYQIRR
jgi:hypothetical protein